MPVCGIMAERYGWASIFYVFGIMGLTWFAVWSVFIYDRPQDDPFISEAELKYITKTLGSSQQEVTTCNIASLRIIPDTRNFTENYSSLEIDSHIFTRVGDHLFAFQ